MKGKENITVTQECLYHCLLERPIVAHLDGQWRFKVDRDNRGEDGRWFETGIEERKTIVPSSWQAVFEDLRDYCGVAWYEREFSVPAELEGRRIAVVFCGVDYFAKVWVNGKPAGEHEGCYEFSLDVTEMVRSGKTNTITIKVTDPEDTDEFPVGMQQELGAGMSGIWRPVWIEATGHTFISDIHVVPDIDKSLAHVSVQLNSPMTEDERELGLTLVVEGPDDSQHEVVKTVVLPRKDDRFSAVIEGVISIDNSVLWYPECPELYRIKASVQEGAEIIDSASTDFGMRKVDIDGKRLRLNNKPLFLMGALDCPDVPNKNIYRVPYQPVTEEDFKRELTHAKEMGLNCLRKQNHVEDHRFLYWADRMGVLILADAPYCPRTGEDPDAERRWHEVIEGMVRRDRNHPCVLYWCLLNETWSLEETPYRRQASIIEDAYNLVKSLDPTRPVMDNSGGLWFDSNCRGRHHKTDIYDSHMYWLGGPEYHEKSRARYPKLRTTDKPLILGEFSGPFYFPDIERLKQRAGGELPWVISKMPVPNYENTIERCEERFHSTGVDKAYSGLAELSERHDWFAFRQLKDEIEQIRMNPDVSGHIITMWNSVGPYNHGMLDYFGEPRLYRKEIAKVHNPDLIIIDWSSINYWSGQTFKANMVLSHHSNAPLRNCSVRWRLDGFGIEGEIAGVTAEEFGPRTIGDILFEIPAVEESVKARVVAELVSDGKVISENFVEVFLYPTSCSLTVKKRRVNVHESPVPAFRLDAAGYETSESLTRDIPVAVSGVWDEKVEAYAAGGGTVLLLSSDAKHLSKLGLGVTEPRGQMGSNQTYWYVNLEKGLFKRIPFENPMGWTFYRMMRRGTPILTGLDQSAGDDVLVNCYAVWLRSCDFSPGASGLTGFIVQLKYGNGRVVVATPDFKESMMYDDDPVAAIMFDDLIQYCFTDFRPLGC